MIRYLATVFILLAAGAAALHRLALAYVPPAQRLRPADVLVVLGHPANADGSPSPAMQEQVALAAALHRAGLAPALLCTGGAVHNEHVEAQVMAALAVQFGIPAAAIATETQARDTTRSRTPATAARSCRRAAGGTPSSSPRPTTCAARAASSTWLASRTRWPGRRRAMSLPRGRGAGEPCAMICWDKAGLSRRSGSAWIRLGGRSDAQDAPCGGKRHGQRDLQGVPLVTTRRDAWRSGFIERLQTVTLSPCHPVTTSLRPRPAQHRPIALRPDIDHLARRPVVFGELHQVELGVQAAPRQQLVV